MYRTVTDFVNDFKEDSTEMAKNFALLTDDALDASAKEGHYNLGETARHLINSWRSMIAEAGEALAIADVPESAGATELQAGWARLSEALPAHIQATWTDAKLAEPIMLWGMEWTNAKVLWEMMKHTVHHHGQMTVLMRLAGLPVHGIYGPSKEESEAMNRANTATGDTQ